MGLTKLVLRFFHNLADLTLVTSPQLKEEMEQWGIKRIAVWRKGIDTQVRMDTQRRQREVSRLWLSLAEWRTLWWLMADKPMMKRRRKGLG